MGFRRFHAGAANQGAAVDMGQRSPAAAATKGRNDLTLTSQRRDKQNRVKTS